MKNKILLICFVVMLFGCKSSSPVATNLDNKTESNIKGDWVMTSVKYPGSDYIKVNSFELFDSKCFIGSEWQFVSNNNKGTLALNNSNCNQFSSDITWYINKEGQFVMKILNAEKAKKVSQGYIMQVGAISENTFQLIDKIKVGSEPTSIIYQFERKK